MPRWFTVLIATLALADCVLLVALELQRHDALGQLPELPSSNLVVTRTGIEFTCTHEARHRGGFETRCQVP